MRYVLPFGLGMVAASLLIIVLQSAVQPVQGADGEFLPLTVDSRGTVLVWCENVSPFWLDNGPSPEQQRYIAAHPERANMPLVRGDCLNVGAEPSDEGL